MFNINDIVNKEDYTKAAIDCNKAGDRHIEQFGSDFIIVANPVPPEPTLEEQVTKMEAETGLTRIIREGILAEGSLYSDYAKAKAQEIEDLAKELRESNPESTATKQE